MDPDGRHFRERLGVPLRWWVQVTMLLASVWLAFVVATPAWLAWTATGALTAVAVAVLGYVGSPVVEVAGDELRAGRARIPVALLGEPAPLDAEQTRRALGVEADARAYLLTRPYLKRTVRVPVADPADPTPYWLVGSRRPEDLVAALTAARTQH